MALKLGFEVGEEKHASRIIQGILLSANFILFVSGKWNSYLIISSIFVLSLFVLQTVNRRFLFLIPLNQFMNRYVKFCDTLILKSFILLSAVFLLFGAYLIYAKSNIIKGIYESIHVALLDYLPFLVGIFLIALPICWYRWGEYSVKKKIVNMLKNEPFRFTGKCPICNGYAEIEHIVLEDGRCKQNVRCYAACANFFGIRPKSFENVYECKIGFVEKVIEVPESQENNNN